MDFYTNISIKYDDILFRGYEDGHRIQKKIKYKPYLFLPSENGKYYSIDNKPLKKIEFNSIKKCREFIDQYKEVDDFEIYGLTNFIYTFINDRYKNVVYDSQAVRVLFLDIEVESEKGFPKVEDCDQKIISITIKYKNKIIVFGLNDYIANNADITYKKCKDEYNLLESFIKTWRIIDCDVVTGWNINLFDIPYLIGRIEKTLGNNEAESLSPWNKITPRQTFIQGRSYISYEIIGIAILDYLDLYKKYSYTQQESYTLNYISHVVLGKKKIDYTEYESLHQLYKKDFQKFIDYNIQDVILVEELDKKQKFIDQVLAIAYSAKINYTDVYSPVKTWDIKIHNYLLNEKNICIPKKEDSFKENQIVGAYVKEPQLGAHDFVVSFDLNSLYPMLIQQYNISPEKFKGKLRNIPNIDDIVNEEFKKDEYKEYYDKNLTIAGNGALFLKDEIGFLAKMMEVTYEERSRFKKEMIKCEGIIEMINKELAKR